MTRIAIFQQHRAQAVGEWCPWAGEGQGCTRLQVVESQSLRSAVKRGCLCEAGESSNLTITSPGFKETTFQLLSVRSGVSVWGKHAPSWCHREEPGGVCRERGRGRGRTDRTWGLCGERSARSLGLTLVVGTWPVCLVMEGAALRRPGLVSAASWEGATPTPVSQAPVACFNVF